MFMTSRITDMSQNTARFKERLAIARKAAIQNYLDKPRRRIPRGNKITEIEDERPLIEIPRFCYREDELDNFPIDLKKLTGKENRESDALETHTEFQIEMKEAAEYIREKLKLPDLREVFGSTQSMRKRYIGLSRVGPNGLVSVPRTWRSALCRTIIEGNYDYTNPKIVVEPRDKRFKVRKEATGTRGADIIYMLDCSGSTSSVIEFLQETAWWIEALIRDGYPDTIQHYIHYDNIAREATRELFYKINPGGENDIGVGFSLARDMFTRCQGRHKFLVVLTDGDYAGLEITSERRDRYVDAITRYKLPPLVLERGNTLRQILDSVDGLFVCEGGAYYAGGVHASAWGSSPNNFSTYLEDFVAENPHASRKIKWISVPEGKARERDAQTLTDTIKALFDFK